MLYFTLDQESLRTSHENLESPFMLQKWMKLQMQYHMEKEKPNHIGISHEIEVPTIDTDTATILEKGDRIVIPINFDNLSRAKTAKKSATKCTACSEILFWLLNLLLLLFSRFHFRCAYAELRLVALLTQSEFSKCFWFLLKNPTIWWKRRDEIDVRRYPCRGSLLQVSMEILQLF